MRSRNQILKLSLLGLASSWTWCSFALGDDPESTRQMLITPNCLLEHADQNEYKLIAVNDQLSLVTAEFEFVKKLSSISKKINKPCGKFINVTGKWENSRDVKVSQFLGHFTEQNLAVIKSEKLLIRHDDRMTTLVNMVQPERIWEDVKELSSFYDRSADGENSEKTTEWFKTKAEKLLKENGCENCSVKTVYTNWMMHQKSVVVILGQNIKQPGVVLSAHMDTLQNNKPGADDDASGSATVMEALRVILDSKAQLTAPVYFIWYAAEEYGLVGSQRIVEDFTNDNIAIKNVLHFDMTGYRNNDDPTVWMITDNVDQNLTEYVANLFETYTAVPVKYTKCGYQCSDHASWFNAGISAAIPAEAKFEQINPYIHTAKDTVDNLSKEHMANFAKVAVAFVGEQATT